MDDFARIRTFLKVVEAGSFSAASRDSSSVSSVARQVKALEDELGARLLHRSTRSLSLTDAGRHFHARVSTIANDLAKLKLEVSSMQEQVRGVLRVALRVTAGTTVVVPALPRFLAQHPDLELDLTLTDERCDLIANHIDVAIWLGPLPDADIVARRLSPSQRIVYASPAYLQAHGTPTTPQDLLQHNCIVYTAANYSNRWSFIRDGVTEEVAVRGNIRTSNGLILVASALSGLGVTTALEWTVRHLLTEGRVVQLLPDYTVIPRPGDADLYAVYPSSRGLSRKVRAFVDFLVETFAREQPPASA